MLYIDFCFILGGGSGSTDEYDVEDGIEEDDEEGIDVDGSDDHCDDQTSIPGKQIIKDQYATS